MLLLGRWSVRMVCPMAKVAAELVTAPLLATVTVQFQVGDESGTLPPVLMPTHVPVRKHVSFVLVAVRSGAVTVTLLVLQLLLVSSFSWMTLLGSTAHDPLVGL